MPSEQPKKLPMPIDRDDESTKALAMLRRFRKQVKTLPEDWQRWVVESLAAGFEDDEPTD